MSHIFIHASCTSFCRSPLDHLLGFGAASACHVHHLRVPAQSGFQGPVAKRSASELCSDPAVPSLCVTYPWAGPAKSGGNSNSRITLQMFLKSMHVQNNQCRLSNDSTRKSFKRNHVFSMTHLWANHYMLFQLRPKTSPTCMVCWRGRSATGMKGLGHDPKWWVFTGCGRVSTC